MAFSHGTPNSIVTDGLVFCVDPANVSSWTGPNSSNVNDLVGTSTNTISNDPSGSYGINKSFIFDGVDDKIATTFNPSTSIGDNNSWTINCWVYNQDVTAGSNQKQRILGSINLGGTVKRFWLGARGGKIRVGYGNNNWQLANNSATYVNNIWQHVAATFDYSELLITAYFNGVAEDTLNYTGTTLISETDIRIGGVELDNVPWIGNISSIGIYNKALSASEVAQNYNALKNRFRT
jgi:hypothetical protein